MKFWEAMKALEEGKLINRQHFDHMQPHGFKGLVDLLKNCGEDEIRSFLSAEWSVYEPPQRTLSFMEMVAGLKEGKTYSRPIWRRNEWISERGGKLVNELNEFGDFLGIEDFEATDWVEVL